MLGCVDVIVPSATILRIIFEWMEFVSCVYFCEWHVAQAALPMYVAAGSGTLRASSPARTAMASEYRGVVMEDPSDPEPEIVMTLLPASECSPTTNLPANESQDCVRARGHHRQLARGQRTA
jgi:hypothetical protein